MENYGEFRRVSEVTSFSDFLRVTCEKFNNDGYVSNLVFGLGVYRPCAMLFTKTIKNGDVFTSVFDTKKIHFTVYEANVFYYYMFAHPLLKIRSCFNNDLSVPFNFSFIGLFDKAPAVQPIPPVVVQQAFSHDNQVIVVKTDTPTGSQSTFDTYKRLGKALSDQGCTADIYIEDKHSDVIEDSIGAVNISVNVEHNVAPTLVFDSTAVSVNVVHPYILSDRRVMGTIEQGLSQLHDLDGVWLIRNDGHSGYSAVLNRFGNVVDVSTVDDRRYDITLLRQFFPTLLFREVGIMAMPMYSPESDYKPRHSCPTIVPVWNFYPTSCRVVAPLTVRRPVPRYRLFAGNKFRTHTYHRCQCRSCVSIDPCIPSGVGYRRMMEIVGYPECNHRVGPLDSKAVHRYLRSAPFVDALSASMDDGVDPGVLCRCYESGILTIGDVATHHGSHAPDEPTWGVVLDHYHRRCSHPPERPLRANNMSGQHCQFSRSKLCEFVYIK